MRLDLLEERAIQAALRHTSGNQRRAAALLGMSRVTLHRKLRAKGSENVD
jgi:DNA-binding NtrC family response regulator